MAAYIVATVRITDPVKFGEYVQAIAGLSEQHGGEYIVRGKVFAALEGDVDPDERVVVSRFPRRRAAMQNRPNIWQVPRCAKAQDLSKAGC